jgi:hypothetical protein
MRFKSARKASAARLAYAASKEAIRQRHAESLCFRIGNESLQSRCLASLRIRLPGCCRAKKTNCEGNCGPQRDRRLLSGFALTTALIWDFSTMFAAK